MKFTKTNFAMFLMLLLTLATVHGYGLLVNKGMLYFNSQLYESASDLKAHPDTKKTVNTDGTITYSKERNISVKEAEQRDSIGKQRSAFIIFAFVIFFIIVYLLAVIAASLVKQLNKNSHNKALKKDATTVAPIS